MTSQGPDSFFFILLFVWDSAGWDLFVFFSAFFFLFVFCFLFALSFSLLVVSLFFYLTRRFPWDWERFFLFCFFRKERTRLFQDESWKPSFFSLWPTPGQSKYMMDIVLHECSVKSRTERWAISSTIGNKTAFCFLLLSFILSIALCIRFIFVSYLSLFHMKSCEFLYLFFGFRSGKL